VVRQAIEQRGRELFVAGEDRDPFGEGEIRGDDDRPPLVAVGEQVEEQLATDAVERDEAQLVDDEDVAPEEPLLQPRELARITRARDAANSSLERQRAFRARAATDQVVAFRARRLL